MNTLTIVKVKIAFVTILHTWLTRDEILAIDEKNQHGDPEICASNEYCEPHIAMGAAIAITLREVYDIDNEEHLDYANKAWDMARKEGFAPKSWKKVVDYSHIVTGDIAMHISDLLLISKDFSHYQVAGYYDNFDGTFTCFDNTSGNYWVEEAPSEELAKKWCNHEIDTEALKK